MDRRKQREHVLMQVYFSEFYGEGEYEKQCSNYLQEEEVPEDYKEQLKARALNVIAKIPELDQKINAVAKWKTSRMNKVDLAILRLALFEMIFDDDIPEGVAINEAVEFAKKYGTDDSPSYINGVLGGLSRGTAHGTDSVPGQPG